MLDLIRKTDAAVVARFQAVADRAWFSYGIGLGDLNCACSVILLGFGLQIELPPAAAMTVIVSVMALVLGGLQSLTQRSGSVSAQQAGARRQREDAVWHRVSAVLASVSILVAVAVTQRFLVVVPVAITAPVLFYLATVMPKPRENAASASRI